MTTKAGLSAKAPEWKPIDDAIVAARKDYNIGGVRHSVAFKKEHEMLDEIEKIVNDLKSNPAAQNIAEFDKMKRAIYQVGADGGNVTGTGPAMKVYGAVKDSIIKESPEYAKLMEQWQGHLVEMNNLRAGVGSNRTAASTALAKMLKSAKTSGKGNLIDRIGEVDKSIPYMLAGAASSPPMREGLLGQWGQYGGALTALAAPTFIPHIVGAALGSSPRVSGAVNYGLGRISPLGKYVTPSLYAGSMADRANAEAKQPIINSSESPMASRAYAGAQPDPIWNRLLIAESGGRQFDNSNKPITSPKGAVGIAQVMPGTGPEAAKLAGLPWDENRFRTDAKYNEAIGRAYYDKQARDFGSPAAALAAYNAGPTAVRQAQQRASAAGSSDFLSYLPKETQNYVRKILGPQAKAAYGGRIQRASGGRAGMNHAAMAERLCAMAARSKNALGRATKPLLQTSDDAIATALAVANRTI
ncbi:MAG: hypothetical protein DWI59_06230 [Chloroflexi bacterium]|nr:MAG: hypothetical protein DWI59_06230 [Chloroflexota bacterium]